MDKLGQIRRLPAASQRVLDELGALGLEDERETLEQEISQLLAKRNLDLSAVTSAKQGRLPTNCTQCGGIVHPKEIEWIDDTTACCDYCGSVLEAS
jgi:hypothetical protein